MEMGIGKLLDVNFKRKFRWLFFIEGIIGDGVTTLPPSKASRPTLSFKSTAVEHLNETISFPTKPDWKPITLILFDTKTNMNPIWEKWIKPMYNPQEGKYNYPIQEFSTSTPGANFKNNASFKKEAKLDLYDGCGNVLESWIYENAYPEDINFDDLSMEDNGIVNITITLKYDRAYIVNYCK